MNDIINLRELKLKLRETVFVQLIDNNHHLEKVVSFTSKDRDKQLEYLDYLLSQKEYGKIRVHSTYEDENGDLKGRILQG